MKLAVYQPMAKPILHTKFHQNRTMGLRSAPALYIMESKGSDPFGFLTNTYFMSLGTFFTHQILYLLQIYYCYIIVAVQWVFAGQGKFPWAETIYHQVF